MQLARVFHSTLWRPTPSAPTTTKLPLEEIRRALQHAETLLRQTLARTPSASKAWNGINNVIVLDTRRTTPCPPPSDWDPELEPELVVKERRSDELVLQEINGCKTLLLEIIRRAAYDWVLYRASTRLMQKMLADQSYRWLFVEEPNSADWNERVREGKYITSFVAICDSLDLDPEMVRGHIRRLTPKNVMSVGRPAEYRKRDVFTSQEHEEGTYSLPSHLRDYESAAGDDDQQNQY
jgi:hypothetical protein